MIRLRTTKVICPAGLLLVIAALGLFLCAAVAEPVPAPDVRQQADDQQQDPDPDANALTGEIGYNREEVISRKEITKPPSYSLLERSLRYYERKMDVKFYRNKQDRYTPYSVAAWDSFTISDLQGECLFNVDVLGLRSFRHLDGKRQVLLDLAITEGPCSLRYPSTDSEAADKVSVMEGTVISPRLIDRLNGNGMCSDKKYIQDSLQIPYRLELTGDDIESSLGRIADRVMNPKNLRFGDLVAFSPYPEERAMGVYVGYGLIVFNSCFSGMAHQMRADGDYRIYRLYNGFAWTRYRIHEQKYLNQYMGIPQ